MQQRCPNCGAPVVPGQRFCGGCGAQLSLACPQCRITVSPGTRFCPNCGATLGGGGVPQQPGWGQQPGGMPQQQPGGMPQQQPGGMPQQPGWGQQPAWAPPAPKSQSSSARPLLLIVLFILLIGLGFLTYKYTTLDETLLSLFNGSTDGTTTVDTTKPVITEVRATDISTVRATVRWTTDDLSSSQVEYGTTDAYGSVMPAQPDTDPSTGSSLGAIEHIVNLTNLELDTTYHYRVKSKNKAGLEEISPDKTFKTQSGEESGEE